MTYADTKSPVKCTHLSDPINQLPAHMYSVFKNTHMLCCHTTHPPIV